MADLEQQLRRYADQVERSVGPLPRQGRARRRRVMVAAAAVVLVGAVIATAWPRGENPDLQVTEEQPSTTALAATTSVSTTTEPGLASGLVPPLDPGPLSERENGLLMRGSEEVLVWGGGAGRAITDDGTSEYYADGAVFDLALGHWRSMAPSPLPAITQTPMGVWVDGRAFVVRDRAAAFYDPETDTWEEIPPAPYAVWELVAMPELGAVAVSGEGGVAVLDVASSTWTDTGTEPADAFNRRIVWTGEELVSVWGSRIGTFRVEGWAPDDGWTDRGVVDSRVSQVAIEVEWVDDEVWIIGYDMTVDAWDPSTATSRSLPPLPVLFQEGVPVVHSFADGTVAVQRSPGIAIWTGEGWEVTPAVAGSQRLVGGAGLAGEPALWSFGFDYESGEGNVLRVEALPAPGELERVQVGSFELTLGSDESLRGQGMTVADTGRVFDPWADIETPDGDCRLTYSGGNRTDATVHIVIGDRAVIVDCDDAVDPSRFLDGISDRWATAEIRPVVVDSSVTAVPSVIGLFLDTGAATLQNARLVPVVMHVTVPFGDVQVGVIIGQSPEAFTEIVPGSEVIVTVGEAGPPPD